MEILSRAKAFMAKLSTDRMTLEIGCPSCHIKINLATETQRSFFIKKCVQCKKEVCLECRSKAAFIRDLSTLCISCEHVNLEPYKVHRNKKD